MLAGSGVNSEIVSIGSTPTATFGERFDGVTEVRVGVFMFNDLVMAALGVCAIDDIAISVLTSVIGGRTDRNWILTDGGWMAMSRDRGTAKQRVDQGYGVVCDIDGRAIPGLVMTDANQEHGIVARRDGGAPPDLPVGTRLRILPNHACATAVQHEAYNVVDGSRKVAATWRRFSGW